MKTIVPVLRLSVWLLLLLCFVSNIQNVVQARWCSRRRLLSRIIKDNVGGEEDTMSPVATPPTNGPTVAVAVGAFHTHLHLEQGYVCVVLGSNRYGQLGGGSRADSTVAVQVVVNTNEDPLTGVVEVVTGGSHAGFLGDGTREERLTPTVVSGLNDMAYVDAAFGHVCTRETSFVGDITIWASWGTDNQVLTDSATKKCRTWTCHRIPVTTMWRMWSENDVFRTTMAKKFELLTANGACCLLLWSAYAQTRSFPI